MGDLIQYCVVLREGKDAGIKHYVWTFKWKIEKIFKSLEFGDEGVIDIPYIAGNDTKHGELPDRVYYDKKKLSSLVFDCKNKGTANKCAKYWKHLEFPLPFPNLKE